MTRSIDYGSLMHRALRSLIDEVLSDVSVNGLPGDHHFFVSFSTAHNKVKISDSLKERYPEEMLIIIQHEYENLNTDPEGFSITLSFGDVPETLYIPYESILKFVDPSVEFGLRFETQQLEETEDGEDIAEEDDDPDPEPHDAEIVSLDSWRK